MTDKTAEVLGQDWVKELLSQPVLARLGTANPKNTQPHVTPVWFEWEDGCIYISVFISTRKGREVIANPRVSVLIDVENPTRAVILEGAAEIITVSGEVARRAERIYTRYVGAEEVQKDPYPGWIHDPENRIIKLRPAQAYGWSW